MAWLHEVLESAAVSERQLRALGVTGDEIAAIKLLTRDVDSDQVAYNEHIERIASAAGIPGLLARVVKRADLRDRLTHQVPGAAPSPARPPYLEALARLTGRTEVRSRRRLGWRAQLMKWVADDRH
ncbi:MAG: hypothetical protein ACXVVQ_19580 [Solirubrobacteraceae bacterium]